MQLTLLDPLGAGCSLLAAYYFTQARIIAFPIHLLAIVINSILYYQKGIYAHFGLQGIYLISSLYGWYHWSAKKNIKTYAPVLITQMPWILKVGFVLIAILSIPALASALHKWTDSTIPYWDAITTILALLAQCMLCKKWIESWTIWFVRDSLVVTLDWTQHIPFHSVLHFIYLGISIAGYFKWRKIMAAQTELNK